MNDGNVASLPEAISGVRGVFDDTVGHLNTNVRVDTMGTNNQWVTTTSGGTWETVTYCQYCQACNKQALYDRLLGILGYDFAVKLATVFTDDMLIRMKMLLETEGADISDGVKKQLLELEKKNKAYRKKEKELAKRELLLNAEIIERTKQMESELNNALTSMAHYKNLCELMKISRTGKN